MNVFAKVAMGSLALCFAAPAWAQSADWTVSEASGRVVVRDAGGDHPVVRGTAVRAGATLLTGVSSRAVLVRGEDFVTVSAASRVRVPDAKAPGMVQMLLEWGTGLFKVKHTDKPHFGVQTPYLAAVVKGTTFTVTVGKDGTSLQVIDGAVGVATIDGGANELIRPGMVAMISASDRYRLSVQGQQSRVIDSPLRQTPPAGPSSDGPSAPKTSETNKGDDAPRAADAGPQKGTDDFAWSDVSDSVITQPIEAKPVDIGTATGGLVSNGGNSSTSVAVIAVVPVARGEDGSAGAGKGAGSDGKSVEPGKGSGGDDKGAEPGKAPGGDDKGAEPGKAPGGDDKGADPGKGSGGDDKGAEPGKGSGGDDKGADPGKAPGGDDKGADPGKAPGGDDKGADPGKAPGGDDKGADPGKGPGPDGKGAGPSKDPGGSDNGASPGKDPGGDKGADAGKDPGGKGNGTDNGNGGGPGKGKP